MQSGNSVTPNPRVTGELESRSRERGLEVPQFRPKTLLQNVSFGPPLLTVLGSFGGPCKGFPLLPYQSKGKRHICHSP